MRKSLILLININTARVQADTDVDGRTQSLIFPASLADP
jgi:hypothetical protein